MAKVKLVAVTAISHGVISEPGNVAQGIKPTYETKNFAPGEEFEVEQKDADKLIEAGAAMTKADAKDAAKADPVGPAVSQPGSPVSVNPAA